MTDAILDRLALELLRSTDPDAILDRQSVELLRSTSPTATLDRLSVEILRDPTLKPFPPGSGIYVGIRGT